MDGLWIRPDVRFTADNVIPLAFPFHVSRLHIQGVQIAIGTLFAGVDRLFIPAHRNGPDEAASYRMAPEFFSLFGQVKQLPVCCADEPASIRFHGEDFPAVKSHAVIIPSCHFSQRHHGTCFPVMDCENLPGRLTPGQPEKGRPCEKQECENQKCFTFFHRYNFVQS